MEQQHLFTKYYAMNTAHLTNDELDHELQIRGVEMMNESRSKQERKLRGFLKSEKEKPNVSFRKCWTSLKGEWKCCEEKLGIIKSQLESKARREAPNQAFKTRLIHIFFRMERLQAHAKEEVDLNQVALIAGECMKLLSTFFSITSPLPEVREAETALANASLRALRDERISEEEVDVDSGEEEEEDEIVVDGLAIRNTEQQENVVDRSGRIVPSGETERENVVTADGAIGGENEGGDRNRIVQLAADNELLKEMVQRLLGRIEALEKEKDEHNNRSEKAKGKVANSTRVEGKSVQNENDVQSGNFVEWIKNRCSSSESMRTKSNEVRSVDEEGEENRKQKREARPNSNRFPVYKWSVRYDGLDNGRRLNEFLKEVEFNARSEEFSDEELFLSAHHLFVRKARSWFMEVNGNNELGSWENLVSELKNEFLPIDIDYQYENLANARKQGPREKFQDYYLDMVRIFRGMSRPWDEARKFDVLFRNTREDCRTAMLAANVMSIPKMKEFGKRFDAINWQMYRRRDIRYGNRAQLEELGEQQRQTYRKGNSVGNWGNKERENWQKQHFKPNQTTSNGNKFSYNQSNDQRNGNWEQKSFQKRYSKPFSQKPGRNADDAKPGSSGTNALQRIVNAYIPIRQGTCFNCHEEGHSWQDCPQKRHEFCKNCGFPGFETDKCPFCQSKNMKRTA